jgi:hypothetical protein
MDYVLMLALAFTVLVGCAKVPETQAGGVLTGGPAASTGIRGVERVTQLALGTLRLEGTENAVTSAQAAELLPLWRMIEGGSLKNDTETDAVLKQIEGVLSGPQLAAINTMELQGGNVQAWMQEQGAEMPAPPAGQGGPGGPGTLQNLSEEERAKMREEFQGMTAEERATRMAEMGIERPEGETGARPAGALGQSRVLLGTLIELLTGRAAG